MLTVSPVVVTMALCWHSIDTEMRPGVHLRFEAYRASSFLGLQWRVRRLVRRSNDRIWLRDAQDPK
jgi:hypothetical protein